MLSLFSLAVLCKGDGNTIEGDLQEGVVGSQKGSTMTRSVANRELRNRRISERVARPSQWSANANFTDEQERQMFEHFPVDALMLDTGHPFDQCVAETLAYLQQEDRNVRHSFFPTTIPESRDVPPTKTAYTRPQWLR